MSAENVQALVKSQGESIATLTKSLTALTEKLSRTPQAGQPSPNQVFGMPWARQGENIMSSRGFSFMKMLGVAAGVIPESESKIEREIAERLHKSYVSEQGAGNGYGYFGQGPSGNKNPSFLAPLATDYMMSTSAIDNNFRREMKQMVRAGVNGADPDEQSWISRKLLGTSYNQKALSWLNELSGGAIVAPPEMGELIELLRNKEALINAGARVVPLPPQGRLKYPRQTGPSNTFWVGENSPITESGVGTGEVTLQAKKLAVLIKAPNELIRFASPAAEALIRDDMTKSLALGLDLAGLEGLGSDVKPLGVINYPNINTVKSSDARSNGDKLVGQDIYRMIAAVEESNAEFEAFIMRPKTLYKFYQLRADAVAQGDSSGAFLFNLIREAQMDTPAMLAGYPVVKSTQVSQVRAKGTGTALTYIVGGMWSDVLIGMFGAIEFAATTMGDTSFTNDQTWVRGILSADIQLRHQSAFALLDNIDLTIP